VALEQARGVLAEPGEQRLTLTRGGDVSAELVDGAGGLGGRSLSGQPWTARRKSGRAISPRSIAAHAIVRAALKNMPPMVRREPSGRAVMVADVAASFSTSPTTMRTHGSPMSRRIR
jgi:hypothetical protein